ncbi:hypothetical protein M885DRAFT_611658 [Pelagophyceae sp. CCMP2097]|nr:hypothetical protein M885DRAFT_611658 [Pelagophyceae sp. CCMP2097]
MCDLPPAAGPKPCCVCAAPGGKQCAKCKSRHYCSKACQLLDWKRGHKAACAPLVAESQGRLFGSLSAEAARASAEGVVPADSDGPPAGVPDDASPDWRGTCAICLDVFPGEAGAQTFLDCCCKRLCTACSDECLRHDERCPLCRAPPSDSNADSTRRLQEHAARGNAEARVQLGCAFRKGEMGLEQSFERAFQMYELAAAQGHAGAQSELGMLYDQGAGTKIDHKTAAHWYRRAAEQGFPYAQYNLGELFYIGKGVAQSHDEAVRWWRLAAAQGYSKALYNLGACHANGEGVPRDLDEALRCFQRAATKRHARAAAAVAHTIAMDEPLKATGSKPCCVCDAPGGKHCTKCKTPHYCSKKCQLVDWKGGHKEQCKQLASAFQDRLLDALMPEKKPKEEPAIVEDVAPATAAAMVAAPKHVIPIWRGTCAICMDLIPIEAERQKFYECCCEKVCKACFLKYVEYDTRCPLCRAPAYKSNAEWVRRVQKHADEGNMEAQVELGYAYRDEGGTLKKNFKRAHHWFERAATQGYARAQLALGYCYDRGCGVKIDHKTAALWYRRAAEQGLPDAQSNLGVCFSNGQGVAQSHDEAVKWFRLAVAQGHLDALYNLGGCHANGQGVPRDMGEALRLCKRAAAKGHAGAKAMADQVTHLAVPLR